MPIETICQGCGRKLRVPDTHAGKQARCPECRRVYTVPEATGTNESDDQQTQPWRPPHDSVKWRLRIPDGRVYGPVPKRELDDWLAEGRISTACQLQSDASPDWIPASQVYPELLSTAATSATYAGPDRAPASETSTPTDTWQSNPYESFTHVRSRRYLRQHRGGMILTLGLLGFCCGLLGVFAWVMGRTDLREMSEGNMDPSGRGTTQAGYVLGIITTLLWAARIASDVLHEIF